MTESHETNALVTASEYAQSIVSIAVDTTPLDAEQARSLTNTIRDAAEVMWVLIARAHAGKAWNALGYATWEAYVRAEFNMSRSRSYQLLDQARVIAALEGAAPEGTQIHLTEAAARDLKTVVEDAVPEIRARTAGLPPEEAAAVIEEILEERRQKSTEPSAQPTPAGASEHATDYYGEADIDTSIAALMSQAPGTDRTPDDEGLAAASELVHTSDSAHISPAKPASPASPTDQPAGVDVARIRRNVNAAHDLYSSLSALAGLPEELDEVVAIIPAERKQMIQANLARATENLERFRALWDSENESSQE